MSESHTERVEGEWSPRGDWHATELPPLDMPLPIWRIVSQRGYRTAESINNLLQPTLSELADPISIKDMSKAVERTVEAYTRNEPITIYADFDLDGTSGLALLRRGLAGLGFSDVRGYQPSRLSEGYGLHAEAIEGIHQQGCQFVISVDVGITAFEAAKKAKELGVDLVITDHHQPANELPDSFAVVNPNRKDCESGLGHLSGAGVAYFFFLAVRRELRERGLLKKDINPKTLLEFFAIGTITDLVPMKAENRVLVKHGLHRFKTTQWPGLRSLMQELGLSERRELGASDIGILLAPKLNALSRMEEGLSPIDVMDADAGNADVLHFFVLK